MTTITIDKEERDNIVKNVKTVISCNRSVEFLYHLIEQARISPARSIENLIDSSSFYTSQCDYPELIVKG